jgi:hypothetical protein
VLMHQLLTDGAARTPDKIAFRWVDRNKTLTYAQSRPPSTSPARCIAWESATVIASRSSRTTAWTI